MTERWRYALIIVAVTVLSLMAGYAIGQALT